MADRSFGHMENEGLGKSVCAAIPETGAAQDDFADLHDFAETYLLDSRQLTKDLAVSLTRDPYSKDVWRMIR